MNRTFLETMSHAQSQREKLINKLIYRKLFPLPDAARQSNEIDKLKRAIRSRSSLLSILNPFTGHLHDSRSTPRNSDQKGYAR